MLYQIKKITIENERKLHLYYAKGGSIIVDFNPIIETGGILAKLADAEFFAQVSIGENSRYIQWPGEIEFCADSLWFQSHPSENKFQELKGQLLSEKHKL